VSWPIKGTTRFIYGLFIDAASVAGFSAPNDTMINEERVRRGVEGSDPDLMYGNAAAFI
jgi:hypothetical protein